jgi:hypothetical protein
MRIQSRLIKRSLLKQGIVESSRKETLTTSRTLKAKSFKKERQGIIKGLAVRGFYSGKEFARRKVLSLQDSVDWPAKTCLSSSSSFMFLSIKSPMNVLRSRRFGSEQFFL